MAENTMKLLYLSCHSILEYDELKLFDELGIDVFSHGAYMRFDQPSDMRPAICDKEVDPQLLEQAQNCTKEHLTRSFVENFDVIMAMHIPDWIRNNWDIMKDKTVIWRTIGQSTSDVEGALAPYRKKGLKIIRYSEAERTLPNYIGDDAIIRFYKDPDELSNWNGYKEQVISVSQAMPQRGTFCSYEAFIQATNGFKRKLFGPRNEDAGSINGGQKSYDDLKREYQDNRVYFYTGTHPASYTLNFVEAFMTGIPIVAVGRKYGSMPFRPDCSKLYEIPEIMNGENGFCSDNISELRKHIQVCLNDYSYAKKIGQCGRKTAISLFGKQKIKEQWRELWSQFQS